MNTKVHKLANDLRNIQTLLKTTKAEESKLRRELAEAIKLESKEVGTHKIQEGDLMIKAVRKVSHSLNAAELEAAWDLLSEQEQSAVNWKPTLSLKVYKQLADTEMLDEYIEVKPAMPAIEVTIIGE